MTEQRPPKRIINGILLLDKPKGISSNHALQKIKRLYNAKKAGHTGSLDPLASGMLPICLGEATKFCCQYLLDADKTYWVQAKLGIRTATGDAEGEIIKQTATINVDLAQLKNVLQQFQGEILQIPSMYSALKHEGKPLYQLARQGITVERKQRRVNIHQLQLINFVEDIATLEVHCSKGTYIRTLVDDIGETLGCGAYVTELRRLTVDQFDEQQMLTIEKLEAIFQAGGQADLDKCLLPVDSAITSWPTVSVAETTAFYIKQGQPVIIPHAPTRGFVRLTTKDGYFIGIGEIQDDGRVAPRRLLKTA